MNYETIKVRFQDSICFLQFDRAEAGNAINVRLVEELDDLLATCEELVTVLVLSGSPEVFCLGADFKALALSSSGPNEHGNGLEHLYDVWLKLATGPYITISHVRGKANAGGVGFAAASDIVLADDTAQFSLSEMLFGLYPACVFPFLERRIGFQKAHYLTLMTHPISVTVACEWGLVDGFDAQSDDLVRRHLLRLRRLSKTTIRRYKTYVNQTIRPLRDLRSLAVNASLEAFSDTKNLDAIIRYVERGVFPWENS
jgi:polyketide biosynthesis enoyl-CoA hydratase PksH